LPTKSLCIMVRLHTLHCTHSRLHTFLLANRTSVYKHYCAYVTLHTRLYCIQYIPHTQPYSAHFYVAHVHCKISLHMEIQYGSVQLWISLSHCMYWTIDFLIYVKQHFERKVTNPCKLYNYVHHVCNNYLRNMIVYAICYV